MDNEDRISNAEKMANELKLADIDRINGLMALEGSRAFHSGYRVGLKDAFFFAFALVIAAITVYTYMEAKDR